MAFYFVGEALAVDFLNTVIEQGGAVRDLLALRSDLAAWARAAGMARSARLAGAGAAWAGEPRRVRVFRESLRRGLTHWAGTGRPGPGLVALLNRYLARDPTVLGLERRGAELVSRQVSQGAPLDRLYAAVARSAAQLVESGAPGRLRKCANPTCRLMFYDVSKAGRRRWCAMGACGARAKVRAYYRRSRGLTG